MSVFKNALLFVFKIAYFIFIIMPVLINQIHKTPKNLIICSWDLLINLSRTWTGTLREQCPAQVSPCAHVCAVCMFGCMSQTINGIYLNSLYDTVLTFQI